MRRPTGFAALALRFALVVALAAAVQTSCFALSVIVNGQVLPPNPPAVQRSGHVLLPMRVVFEALGATVKWDNATQTAIGTRGDITVKMSINQNIAYINDRAVPLDVPPQLINGSTYVPVRFPAEAFGAQVGWNNAAQVVSIDLAPLAATQPAQPEQPAQPAQPEQPAQPVQPAEPVQPAAPQPGSVQGVIAAPAANRVTLIIDNNLKVFPITPTTIILENGVQVAADRLNVGDAADVQFDAQGNATMVRAIYQTVEGVVQAKVPNQLLLSTQAQPYKIAAEASVVTAGGRPATYADLRVGDKVALRVTPDTMNAYGILIQRPEARRGRPTVAEPAGPTIDRFFANADHPLRAGETLDVMLEGTPGGRAWFDLGDIQRDISLHEDRDHPGHYRARFQIQAGMTARGVPLLGHLEVHGRAAEVAQSAEPVTIDTTPPEVHVLGLHRGEKTTNRRPNLSLRITDEGGSGIDWDHTTVGARADGHEIPVKATAHGQFVRIDTAELPPGNVVLTVHAVDKAGNETTTRWPFTVAGAPVGQGQQPTLSVRHNATGVLMPGEDFTVTATGPPGGQATLDLGKWRENLPMHEEAGHPGTYQAQVPIPTLNQDRSFTPRVLLKEANGQTLQADATEPVLLARHRNLTPVITSPTAGQKVGDQVVVEGETQPLAQVTLTITWKGTLLRILEQTGQVGQTQVTADVHGHFRTDPIALGTTTALPVKNVTYVLTATATNARGQTSQPVEIEFTR